MKRYIGEKLVDEIRDNMSDRAITNYAAMISQKISLTDNSGKYPRGYWRDAYDDERELLESIIWASIYSALAGNEYHSVAYTAEIVAQRQTALMLGNSAITADVNCYDSVYFPITLFCHVVEIRYSAQGVAGVQKINEQLKAGCVPPDFEPYLKPRF